MKKVLSSLILFFTLTMQISCSSLYPSVDVVPTTDWWKDYTPSVEVFQINDVCPNICWLGIHPGTTSIENAAGILMESNQIDQQSIQASETEVEAIWYPDQEKKAQTTVILYLDRGFVTSIRYYNLMPFTVEKFVNILGEPGEIRIELLVSPHDWFDLVYSIYFPVQKAEITAYAEVVHDGPHPNDLVRGLILNTDFRFENQQPWLGYGHLEEYLPGEEIPK